MNNSPPFLATAGFYILMFGMLLPFLLMLSCRLSYYWALFYSLVILGGAALIWLVATGTMPTK